jgi:hypothetical protein
MFTKFILKTKSTRRLSVLIFILMAGIVFTLHINLYQYAYDDAYIHFRIARNFLDNGTPYFNEYEMVKVSTSSGWTILLAFILKASRILRFDHYFPLAVSIVNAMFTLGGMVVYAKIVEELQGNKLSLSSKIFFQIPFLALLMQASIGLMETSLALLMAGWGILFILRLKPSGFALLGLAAYVRIELSILLILITFLFFIENLYRYKQVLAYIAVGIIPLLIYDLYFFETVIPHAIIAKSTVFLISRLDTIRYILFYSLPAPSHTHNAILISFILFIGILTSTVIVSFRRQKEQKGISHILFLFWGLLTISGYVYGHALMFQWYIPLYTIPILIACFIGASSIKHLTVYLNKTLVFVLFLMSVIFFISTTYASTHNPGVFINFTSGARVRTYIKVGKILFEEYPYATLMTTEIGGLGYSFEGKILDAAGLASPDVLAYHPMDIPEQRDTGGIGAIPPGYVIEKMPSLIVSYDYFTQALLKDDMIHLYNMILIPAYIPEDAELSTTGTIAGNKHLRIYIRKDLPISEKILALEH